MDRYNIIKLSEVNSTNDYILTLRKKKYFKEGLVVVSGYQSKGIGQRGNSWISERGQNLTISILIEPRIPSDRQFDINRIATLSTIYFLNSLGVESKIKWPNDIIVNDQKVAGFLIKNIVSNNLITHSIIGIGLNVNQLVFPPFSIKATSLRLIMKKQFSVQDIERGLLSFLRERVLAYRSGNLLYNEYISLIYKLNQEALFLVDSKKIKAVINGVTAKGLLEIKIDKVIKTFDLKDVALISDESAVIS